MYGRYKYAPLCAYLRGRARSLSGAGWFGRARDQGYQDDPRSMEIADPLQALGRPVDTYVATEAGLAWNIAKNADSASP